MAQQDRAVGLIGSLGMKPPCRVATSTDKVLSGIQVIDEISTAENDRILVKAQTDPVENGIYYVKTADWERAPDFDGVRDVLRGTTVPVAEGTIHANTIWMLSSSGVLIGTSELSFIQIIGSGGGGGLTASAFMQTVLDDTTALIARTTLGAAATNGDPAQNFSVDSLAISGEVFFPGPSKMNSTGWLGVGITPAQWLTVYEAAGSSSTRHTANVIRSTDHTGGLSTSIAAALRVDSTANVGATNAEYAFASYLQNYAASSYNIAGFFEGNKRFTGNTQAGAFIARDHTAVANPTGALNGVTVGMYGNGTDGFSTRVGIEVLVSRQNLAGAAVQVHAGLRIGVLDADSTGGYYRNGIIVTDNMNVGIRVSNSGSVTSYGILDDTDKLVGIYLSGTYTQAAVQIHAGEKIAFEASGTSVLRASAAFPNIVGFEGCWVNFEQSWGVTGGAANISSSASAGAASALPGLPSGYVKMRVDGTTYKIPYYN